MRRVLIQRNNKKVKDDEPCYEIMKTVHETKDIVDLNMNLTNKLVRGIEFEDNGTLYVNKGYSDFESSRTPSNYTVVSNNIDYNINNYIGNMDFSVMDNLAPVSDYYYYSAIYDLLKQKVIFELDTTINIIKDTFTEKTKEFFGEKGCPAHLSISSKRLIDDFPFLTSPDFYNELFVEMTNSNGCNLAVEQMMNVINMNFTMYVRNNIRLYTSFEDNNDYKKFVEDMEILCCIAANLICDIINKIALESNIPALNK